MSNRPNRTNAQAKACAYRFPGVAAPIRLRFNYVSPLILFAMLVVSTISNGCRDESSEPVPKPVPSVNIVLGYYFNFGNGFDVTQIMYQNLTHVAHAFAIPNADGTLNLGGISSQMPGFAQTVHQNNKKAILSVGGWNGSLNFPGIAADTNKRHVFASALRTFCVSNKYDGVDIDWEFPTFRQGPIVTSLIREIGDSLRGGNTHFTLSITIPPSIGAMGFVLADLKDHLDWIGIMTYDYSTCASSNANDNAPLPKIQSDMAILLESVAPEKLLFGFPFYGRQYHCPSGPALGAASDGCVEMPFATLPDVSQGGWQRGWDTASSVPYLVNQSTNHLISFDDQQSIQSKCQWLKEKKLGGAIMWALGQDGSGSNQPLLCLVGKELLGTGCTASPESATLTIPR